MNDFNLQQIDVRFNEGFSPKTICSFSNIITFRDLPYSFDLKNQELVRYPAYFYGFSFDKFRCNYSLWLTTGTKKNINILIPFFYNLPNSKLCWHLNNKSKPWFLYLIQNSFLNSNKTLDLDYITVKKNQFYTYNYGLSDVTLNIQKYSNKFHRVINSYDLDLDFSISTYNFKWSGKHLNYKQRDVFNLINDAFLYSSFFINSFDSSVILYPQSYFEYNFFNIFLINAFNIVNIFDEYSFDKFRYLSIINILHNYYLSIFYDYFISFKVNNNIFMLFIKLILFRIFKSVNCNFNYLIYTKYKLNFKLILYYMNLFFPNIFKNNSLFIFSYLPTIKCHPLFNINFYFFKELKKLNFNKRLLMLNFFVSKFKNLTSYLSDASKKFDIVLSSDTSTLGLNSFNWIFYYLKERKNALFKSRYFTKVFNFGLNKCNKLIYNYSVNLLSIRNDFLFKTLWYKSKFDKNIIIYSWGNKYSFGKKRTFSGLFFLSNEAVSFTYYKYNTILFESIMLFFDNLFKFISFNINNILISSLNLFYYDLYFMIYNFFSFYLNFIKKQKNKPSSFFFNNLFIKYLINNRFTKKIFNFSNKLNIFNKLIKNKKHYRFYL